MWVTCVAGQVANTGRACDRVYTFPVGRSRAAISAASWNNKFIIGNTYNNFLSYFLFLSKNLWLCSTLKCIIGHDFVLKEMPFFLLWQIMLCILYLHFTKPLRSFSTWDGSPSNNKVWCFRIAELVLFGRFFIFIFRSKYRLS